MRVGLLGEGGLDFFEEVGGDDLLALLVWVDEVWLV